MIETKQIWLMVDIMYFTLMLNIGLNLFKIFLHSSQVF